MDLKEIKDRCVAARVWSKPNPGTPTWNDVAALIAEVERLRPMEEALREIAANSPNAYALRSVEMARAALSPDTKEEE